MTKATIDGRSATWMPWEGVIASNTGPSIGPLTRTQTPAAATRPTANHLLRRMTDSFENRLVTGQGYGLRGPGAEATAETLPTRCYV
jgi:hypothetical protein